MLMTYFELAAMVWSHHFTMKRQWRSETELKLIHFIVSSDLESAIHENWYKPDNDPTMSSTLSSL